MRVCASACSMRATDAAMSRLARYARSTSIGQLAASGSRATSPAPAAPPARLGAASRYFGGVSTTGTVGASTVSMQPDRSGASASARHARAVHRSPSPLADLIELYFHAWLVASISACSRRGAGQSASFARPSGDIAPRRREVYLLHHQLIDRPRGAHLAPARHAAARDRTAPCAAQPGCARTRG